ncbi:MAG: hypothetical protein KGP28_02765 [Bdellovibrionales bacterium]|nr:hypothetical protein [Bdellovibrionales bacterium]
MKVNYNFFAGLGMLLSLSGLSACGNAGGNVDPLSLFNDSSIPLLEPIVGNFGIFGTGTTQPFTAANPFWRLLAAGSFGGANYLAPARGIVTSSGIGALNGETGFSLTIAHSGRLATRFVGLTPVVRTGDSVLAGQVIGAIVGFSSNSGAVGFQVLLDGSPICPLSFLSSNFRLQLGGAFGVNAFCQ